MGLFILENAKKGEPIVRYSGEAISRAERDCRSSHYIVAIHKNLYLDSADPKHFEGRHINDGKRSRRRVNAKFASNYRTNLMLDHWVPMDLYLRNQRHTGRLRNTLGLREGLLDGNPQRPRTQTVSPTTSEHNIHTDGSRQHPNRVSSAD